MSVVLVLDPDPDVRGLFGRLVRRLGHKPIFEPPSNDETGVDVVLLEPAWAAARARLEAVREQQPNVYVVCASIYPREEATSLGADAFIPKPISNGAIERALRDGTDG